MYCASPVDDAALLETIAQLQRHLDALTVTNQCLTTQLENAKQGANQVQERVGRSRDDDGDDRPHRRARRRADDDDDFGDEYQPVVHRGGCGMQNSQDSLSSSVTTVDAEIWTRRPPGLTATRPVPGTKTLGALTLWSPTTSFV